MPESQEIKTLDSFTDLEANAKVKKYTGFYQRLRRRINGWAKKGKLERKSGRWTDRFFQYLLLLPDLAHLLLKLLLDRKVAPFIKS